MAILQLYDFKNKEASVRQSNDYMVAKTLSMFEWEGLPETIPYNELEKLLQLNGWAYITEVEGELYAFTGGLGGEVDVYGNPTKITINNVALKYNKTLNIADDGVLVRSDDMLMGIRPILTKYNTLMAENDLNMLIYGYNSRITTLLAAADDNTRESAEKFLEQVVKGELGVIADNKLFEGLKSHIAGKPHSISTLIEYQQYIKASMHHEIGLNANFNMKRERLNSAEVLQNEDTIYPFVDNMMKCRLNAVRELNEKYGLELDVDYGSVWGDKKRERVDDVVDLDRSDVFDDERDLPRSPQESISEQLGDGNDGSDSDDTEQPVVSQESSGELVVAEQDEEEEEVITPEVELEEVVAVIEELEEAVVVLEELEEVKEELEAEIEAKPEDEEDEDETK